MALYSILIFKSKVKMSKKKRVTESSKVLMWYAMLKTKQVSPIYLLH